MTSTPGDRHLTAADAAVAVGSFPRRFRSVFAGVPSDDRAGDDRARDDGAGIDELSRRLSPSGTSAADELRAADAVVSAVHGAVEQVRRDRDAVLHPALADVGAIDGADLAHSSSGDAVSLAELLDQFTVAADALGSSIGAMGTVLWAGEVRIAGSDDRPPLLHLLQDAVAAVASRIRGAQQALDAVR